MATDTRARMLETTGRLLQHRGVHGASLNDILAESGAPRGSLYFHFPGGKDQLVLEATRAGVEQVTRVLVEVLADARDPAAGVRTYVVAAAQELRDSGFVFGCPVASVVLDSPESSALARLCRDALAEWHRILEDGLATAGIGRRRAASLATLIVSALEGALLLARARRDTAPLDTIADELAALVKGAQPRARRPRPGSRAAAPPSTVSVRGRA